MRIRAFFLFFIVSMLTAPVLWGQQVLVSGKVTTPSGEPAAGATVAVKGTREATVVDDQGNYSIRVPNRNSTLVFSLVGMETIERPVSASGINNVSFQLNQNQMNEVVVIGYGTQKKSVLTGAISSVKASDIDNQPIARIEQFLQGRASGVTIAASSGQPGASSTLRIRGNLHQQQRSFVCSGWNTG